jgi:hypothetical protein
MEASTCLMMNNIGKPCTEKPYAKFDQGGQVLLYPYSNHKHLLIIFKILSEVLKYYFPVFLNLDFYLD